MNRFLTCGLCCAVVFAAETTSATNELQGDVQLEANSAIPEAPCDLYQGDLGAEIGVGCIVEYGSVHGPNFAAVSVTAPVPAPFYISSYYYNIFTNIWPNFTALTFNIWAGGEVPGARLAYQVGLAVSPGYHRVAITPAIMVPSAQFFFGATQPQTTAAVRLGLDTSSGGGTTSFIKAPFCGLSAWQTMTSIGFAGNWVMSVCVPMSVPVELGSWGQIKTVWK